MLRLISKITFNQYDKVSMTYGKDVVFDFCESIEIKSSFEDFTDTARITLPRKVSMNGRNIFFGDNALFKRHDKVKIELGYNPKLRTVFEGYITEIGSNVPIEILCEDEMFILKNTKITYPEKTGTITHGKPSKKYPQGKLLKKPIVVSDPITLYELLDYCLPDHEFECPDVNLGQFRATKSSIPQILDELKKTYGFYSYFKGLKLHVGLPSDASQTNTEEFAFEENIINEDELKYQIAEDLSMKVVAISMQMDNSKIEVEVGDSDGAQKTFHVYNTSESDLKAYATLKLNEVRYTGYVGTVRTFGEPYMRHGDIAKITSVKLPERNGNYTVKSVRRIFNVEEAYKQELELDIKVGTNTNIAKTDVLGRPLMIRKV